MSGSSGNMNIEIGIKQCPLAHLALNTLQPFSCWFVCFVMFCFVVCLVLFCFICFVFCFVFNFCLFVCFLLFFVWVEQDPVHRHSQLLQHRTHYTVVSKWNQAYGHSIWHIGPSHQSLIVILILYSLFTWLVKPELSEKEKQFVTATANIRCTINNFFPIITLLFLPFM